MRGAYNALCAQRAGAVAGAGKGEAAGAAAGFGFGFLGRIGLRTLGGGPAGCSSPTTGLGSIGMWVNGVAIFNELDGGSYSNAAGDDQGGGGVSARASHFSSASQERGPLAAS